MLVVIAVGAVVRLCIGEATLGLGLPEPISIHRPSILVLVLPYGRVRPSVGSLLIESTGVGNQAITFGAFQPHLCTGVKWRPFNSR